MSTNCTHTLANGETCNAPAVSGTPHCRHHYPQSPLKEPKPSPPVTEKFELPPIRDKDSILAAIIEVLKAMADRRIKRSEAETFIRGFKFAARLMTEIDEECVPSFPAQGVYDRAQLHPAELITNKPNGSPQQPVDHVAARQTTRTAAAQSQYNNGSVALAASGNRSKGTNTFNPAHLYPEHAASIDPSTARLVKDLLAQSHQLASTQKAKS
jgi:hypothetical protein